MRGFKQHLLTFLLVARTVPNQVYSGLRIPQSCRTNSRSFSSTRSRVRGRIQGFTLSQGSPESKTGLIVLWVLANSQVDICGPITSKEFWSRVIVIPGARADGAIGVYDGKTLTIEVEQRQQPPKWDGPLLTFHLHDSPDKRNKPVVGMEQ